MKKWGTRNLFFLELTPYDIKFDVMWRLMQTEPRYIFATYDHMGESLEKSNHTAQRLYHNHTMKDGGYATRHRDCHYSDLLYTFRK